MSLSLRIKSFLALPLLSSGIARRRLRKLSRASSLILMYHRVTRPAPDCGKMQAGMYVFPETFRAHLRFLKLFFRVVPLAQLHREEGGAGAPYCSITFDDGWRDFYTEAFPLLRQEGLPATVFLPTDYIGTHRSFWTDRLAVLLENRCRPVGGTGSHGITEKLLGPKGGFESRLEQGIALLKGERSEVIERVLADLGRGLQQGSTGGERSFLSWDEVREMRGSGLVTYGSHTRTHSILTTLREEEIAAELKESRERLVREGAADPEFIPFCYPNGDYTDRISVMVREAGYSMAVTTWSGWNEFGADPYTLKRIGIHQDMSGTRSLLACRVVGIF